MRTVSWSLAAGRQFDLWIDHISDEVGGALAQRAKENVTLRVGRLDTRALTYRRSLLWPGLHELSLPPWHKLAVYSVADASVDILALYDQRQDLSAVDPFSE